MKESPQAKEYTEVEVEIKQPPAGNNFQQGTEERLSNQSLPPAPTHNNAPPPLTKVQSGKIIVPLTSFVLASKSSEPIINLDKVIVKQPISVDPAATKFSAAESKETPTVIGNKSGSHKAEQSREKGQEHPVAAPHHHPGAHQHHHHPRDPPTKTSRDKHISSSSSLTNTCTSRGSSTPTFTLANKKPLKNLPPLLSTLRSLGSDKMKGNNEGALLVACRVGEEDQVLRLLKELTATGVLDASVLNQADRSGRVSIIS